jgi:two-component system, NtrC family, sensor kinase
MVGWTMAMADERDARIAQLEAELAAVRADRDALAGEVHRLRPALAEALEQQTATAEVLRVIASSPTNLKSVLDATVASALRVLDVDVAIISQPQGDQLAWTAYGIADRVPRELLQ